MRKYEKEVKDLSFGDTWVKLVECSDNSIYFVVSFLVDGIEYQTQYTLNDKMLYFCQYPELTEYMTNKSRFSNIEFYDTPIYKTLQYLYNGEPIFKTLYNAINFVKLMHDLIPH